MSRDMNNFTPLPGSWQRGFRYFDDHTLTHSESNEVPVFYRSHSTHATDGRSSVVLARQRFSDFRNPLGFHSIPNSFPAPTTPPRSQQIHVHNEDMGRLRDIFLPSSPRSRFQPSTQAPPVVEISKSTVLSNLKKVIYNPPPTRYARRVSLYHRNNAAKPSKEKQREKDEDGKNCACAVCLEDFEPNEEVMLTPCKHMFHENCIVPWITSKGQCPVCRFVICVRERENPSHFNNNGSDNLEPSNFINGELLSILRAMEEAFQLGSMT